MERRQIADRLANRVQLAKENFQKECQKEQKKIKQDYLSSRDKILRDQIIATNDVGDDIITYIKHSIDKLKFNLEKELNEIVSTCY